MNFLSQLSAKAFPRRFVQHSLATHLSGVFAIEPRPLELAVEDIKVRLAATPAAELRELATRPRADRAPMMEREQLGETSAELEPKTYCARIPVQGVLVRGDASCARMMGADATGLDELAYALEEAIADPEVSEIVLEVSSPGGVASGIQAIVDQISAGKAKKPIRAEISGQCASAALWLVSGCTEIIAEQSAIVGSMGVFAIVVDSSKAAEAEGHTVHVLRSGPHKGVGVPGTPVTNAQLAAVQTIVNDLAAIFVQAIVNGRGLSEEQAKALATGDAWVASKALDRGLIDAVGMTSPATGSSTATKAATEISPRATALGIENNTPAPEPAASTEDTDMPTENKPAAVAGADTLEALRAMLAQAESERALAAKRAELAEAQVASFADAKKNANKARIKTALDAHAKAATFAPAERPSLELLGAKFEDDPSAFEDHLDTRAAVNGAIVKRTPTGKTPDEPSDADDQIAAIDQQIANSMNISLEQARLGGEVIAVRPNGLQLADGKIVKVAQ